MAKRTAKKVAKRPTKTSQKERVGAPNLAAPSPALGKPEIKKIQGLLKSKTADGVMHALSLLESLVATRADYEAVFTETVIKSILGGWAAESWGAVAKALAPYEVVSQLFQRRAESGFLARPAKTTRLRDFLGLSLALRVPGLRFWRSRARHSLRRN